jgi:hypothetical protein
MKYFHKFLMASICLMAFSVSAQWQWTDKDGRKVYSDRAPPPDILDKNILKRPGVRSNAPVVTQAAPSVSKEGPPLAASSAAQGGASAPKISGVDKELFDKKKKAEEAELAQRKAEEERVVKAKIESCARAKQVKANFDSGLRIARTNAKGEREMMDDTARAAEAKRIQAIINTDCK